MAAPDKDKDKEKTEEKAEKPLPVPWPRGSKLVLILLGLNTVLVVAVLVVMLLILVPAARHAAVPTVAAAGGAENTTEIKASAPPEKTADKPPAEKIAEKGTDKGKAPSSSPLPGPTVRLPDFVVHLRDVDSERYARLAFELEVGAEPDKEKIQAHLPRLRDALLAYLSDRTVADLRGSENIARMKQALLDIVKGQVTNVPCRALYITDLVIQ